MQMIVSSVPQFLVMIARVESRPRIKGAAKLAGRMSPRRIPGTRVSAA